MSDEQRAIPQTAEEWIDAVHAIPEDERAAHEWVFEESQRTDVVDALKRLAVEPFTVRDDGSVEVHGVIHPPQVLGYPLRFLTPEPEELS